MWCDYVKCMNSWTSDWQLPQFYRRVTLTWKHTISLFHGLKKTSQVNTLDQRLSYTGVDPELGVATTFKIIIYPQNEKNMSTRDIRLSSINIHFDDDKTRCKKRNGIFPSSFAPYSPLILKISVLQYITDN